MSFFGNNYLLNLLLLITFLKVVIWAGIIPAWQAPDEQNHFSLIQFYAETGKLTVDPKYDNTASSEIIKTLDFMNTNWEGVHPVWRPEFSDNKIGQNEEKIKNIEKSERNNFLFKTNGRKNPPLYYHLAAIVYRIFSPFDILVRLFAIRIFGALLATLTVLFTYLFIRRIWPQRSYLALVIASLVSFHPSFNFIASTLNADVMVILITTIFLYISVGYILDKTKNLKQTLALASVSLVGMVTKATLIPLVILSVLTIGMTQLHTKKPQPLKIALAFLFLLFGILYFVFSTSFGFTKDITVFAKEGIGNLTFLKLSEFVRESFGHYNNQVFGWYWAVFGWLEVSLPINFYRVFKILFLVSIIGLLISIYKKRKKLTGYKKELILFFFAVLLIFHGSIVFFDFQTFTRTGDLFGFQGRHFLAPLSLHMLILATGLSVFIKAKFKNWSLFLISIFFIFINYYSLFTMIHYFYPTTDISTLLNYLSEYKPFLLKSSFLVPVSVAYSFLVLLFVIWLFKFAKNEKI